MTNERKEEIVRLENWRMGFYDGHYGLWGLYKQDGSGFSQGYCTDDDFVKGVLRAVGVNYVDELDGKKCLLTATGWRIGCTPRVHKIAPLLDDERTAFDIEAWSNNLKSKQEVSQ